MKVKASLVIMLAILFIFIGHNLIISQEKNDMNVLLLPSLPKPIAKEYALITSAGQCTDSYIINDIANQLMIHNYFVPQAEEQDLDGINTLVFVVGYSSLGTKLHDIRSDDEENRIKKLINKSKKEDKVIITVFIGGKQRRVDKADMLLKLVCAESDYIIGTKEANYDNLISDLAKSNRIPLTLINSVNDISEPFASAFR